MKKQDCQIKPSDLHPKNCNNYHYRTNNYKYSIGMNALIFFRVSNLDFAPYLD